MTSPSSPVLGRTPTQSGGCGSQGNKIRRGSESQRCNTVGVKHIVITPTPEELQEAAHHVAGEWVLLAENAARLPANRVRTQIETSALEAMLVHARCLIHFCCGGYKGRRNRRDIVPENFLGADWWPRDEDFDRKLRGRLRFIDEELQHLSWQRVLNKAPLMVSMTLLAAEVHWAMHLFVEELRAKGSPWLATFEIQEHLVREMLPSHQNAAQTTPHLAPARPNPVPPA